MNFGIDPSRANLNPCWGGRNVEVHFMTEDFIVASSNDRQAYAKDVMPFHGSRHMTKDSNWLIRMKHYEHVATISYKWVVAGGAIPPFGILQNAFSSWHESHGIENETFTLEVVDEDAKRNGYRSLSIGDVVHDLDTKRWYMVDGTGYTRLILIEDLPKELI